jgi:hypothetical protein
VANDDNAKKATSIANPCIPSIRPNVESSADPSCCVGHTFQ